MGLVCLGVGLFPACSGGSNKANGVGSSSAASTMTPSAGGEVKLGGGFVLKVPAEALSAQSRVSVKASDAPADLPLAASVGAAYDVDLGGASLRAPATVTVPVRLAGLLAGATFADVFLARFDQSSASWEPLVSKVDASAGTVTASVDHFSKVQAFAAKVQAAAAAFLDFYTKGLQAVGIRAAPPTCASPPPAGVRFSLVPKSTANAGPSNTIPAGNLVHLVLGCPDSIAGDQVKIKVANNRSYAQLLVPGQGAQVSVDRVDNGSVSETLAKAIRVLFESKGVYLPGTGEADLTITVPAGTTTSLETHTSQLTLFIDGGLRLIDVFVPETHKADAGKCLYDAGTTNGAVPPLRDVVKITKDCITPFATGVAAVILGPVSLYIENQMQQLTGQIDSSANAVVGGSERVEVAVAATPKLLVGIDGSVGDLKLSQSTQANVQSTVGTPEAVVRGDFQVPSNAKYRALGYGCSGDASAGRRSLNYVGGTPYCLTVYYLDDSTGVLQAFYTASQNFATRNGTTVGTQGTIAESNEGEAATSGCQSGIFEFGKGPATIYLPIPAGTFSAPAAGPVAAIESEYASSGVGLLFC